MIYYPSEDTFILAEVAEKIVSDIALDVGTGSGYIAFILSKNSRWVLATDINIEAIKNVLKIKRERNINNLDLIVCNLFDAIREKKVDLITFNPPYLPPDNYKTGLETETVYLNYNGKNLIIEFLEKLKSFMKNNSECYIVLSSLTGIDYKLLEKLSLKWNEVKNKKLFFETLFVLKLFLSPNYKY